jgi:hypothetical protein
LSFLLLSVSLDLSGRVVDRVLSVWGGRGESEGSVSRAEGRCGEARCSNRLASRLVWILEGE